jgi:nitroimidazol reductase NimA-like FMN-containing flavoprotein (pyridoxamine 5'-phosphate oxidase superfamily)
VTQSVQISEVLSRAQCEDLLSRHRFGRIGVHTSDGPAIFPVNYVWSSGRIVIRTAPGLKVTAAVQNEVAFEIDEADEKSRSGWSVLVVGVAYEVSDAVDEVSEALRNVPVDVWAPGAKDLVLRIEPRSITGRAIGRSEDVQ